MVGTSSSIVCNKCKRTATAPNTMWELVGGGTSGWECRSDGEGCVAEQRRLAATEIARAKAEREARDLARPSTDEEFFAEFGVTVAELSPGPLYRDYHRHFVHLPTGRSFKHTLGGGGTKRWSETTRFVVAI